MTTFSLLAGLGASLGLLRLKPQHLPGGLAALAGALLGARIEYILLNPSLFTARPMDALQFWQGGLGWAGALVGAVLAVLIIAAARRQPLAALADNLVPMLLPLTVALWLACWQAGAGYGVLLDHPFLSFPAADELGLVARRWPVQPTGALLSLAGLALLENRATHMKAPGLLAGLSLIILPAVVAVLSPVMADPAPGVLGLRRYAAEALVLALLGAAASLAAAFAARLGSRSTQPDIPPV